MLNFFKILTANNTNQQKTKTFSDVLRISLKNVENTYKNNISFLGIKTGLENLDKKLGGLRNSELIIIAGRPGMGKTALATNIAYNVSKTFYKETNQNSKTVAFFSLEMSSEQLATRILSNEARVSSSRIRTGEIEESEFEKLTTKVRGIEDFPLFIDDTHGLTVSKIKQKARKLKQEKELGLVIIDYLQLIPFVGASNKNRDEEISEITRDLKNLAKELDVPIICLSQLNRNLEKREDKRPMLYDLRGSGSIEEYADIVLFIFREFYYLERNEPIQKTNEANKKFEDRYLQWKQNKKDKLNVGEVLIAKHNNGATGIIELWFNHEYTQFSDLNKHL